MTTPNDLTEPVASAPMPGSRPENDELVETLARALSRSEHPGVQAYIDARAALAVLPVVPAADEHLVEKGTHALLESWGATDPAPNAPGLDDQALDRVRDDVRTVLGVLPTLPVADEEAAVRALSEYKWGGRSLAMMSHEYREIVRLVLGAARVAVVDVDVIREFIAEETGFDNGAGMTDQAERLAARLRGAPRG